jgi:hypothetical protein
MRNMFCTTCGKNIDQQAAVCLGCGCHPLAGRAFCWNCGKPTDVHAVVCVGCGAALTPPAAPATGAKPGKLTALAVLTLVAGVINCMTGLALVFGCWTIVCTPFFVAMGVAEIIYATKLLPEPIKVPQLSPVMPILQIAAIILFNPVSVTAGILSLIFANDPEVKAYFAAQNQAFARAPIAPVPPPSAPATPS